jgi:hypothetical protein
MAFIHQMNYVKRTCETDFVKRSYESLVYIPVREMEPVKIYDSSKNSWLNSLLSRSGWFTWDIVKTWDNMDNSKSCDIKDTDIVWILKNGENPLEELGRDKILEVD